MTRSTGLVQLMILNIIIACLILKGASGFSFASVAHVVMNWTRGLTCYFQECCGGKWISSNLTALQVDLNRNIHGQELAIHLVMTALKSHQERSKKPLVMVFHGGVGTGKNYVADFIAKHMFHAGLSSEFLHKWLGYRHFLGSDENATEFKRKVQTWVYDALQRCDKQLFIIDEVDAIGDGVLDGLTPYMDFHEDIDGVSAIRSVFLFLTNAGSEDLIQIAEKNWESGHVRSNLKYHDFREALEVAAFNQEGGLKLSRVVKKALIDYHIPFIPLEKKHVKHCIEDEFQRRRINYSHEDVETILKRIGIIPSRSARFAQIGCKRVAIEVDIYLNEIEHEHDHDHGPEDILKDEL
ncbi:unnamed protein product [Darwinula stevensoni]|uniref:Torsin n=1 Tax=Darwinula stevensoni TaxID=69355 RepID=A0A7R9A1R5_9CRUS|nr:unnamed protein product [Darwinula stevensoni]CAG0878499.1 unnamed protein product [Darwinula stevensoni]